MPRSVLDRATALSARGRYGELIVLLEPQLPIYRESHRFYYLLGSACLHTGDNGGAYTYLKRAEQLDPRDPDTLLCVAALHLRRGETQKAIEYYLRVQEMRPGDPLAERSMAFMRRPDAEESIPRLIETGGFDRFYPKEKRLPRFLVPLAAVAAAAVAAWFLVPLLVSLIASAKVAGAPRPEIAAVVLNDAERTSPVETGGSYSYILTEKEALAGFERAKALFQAYRDNAALVILNRLILSNAAPTIREKARILRSFVSPPDFRTIKDVPAYKDVAREPALYDGCSVLWQGSAANITAAAGRTDFHFLVGYVNGQRLDGIVPVSLAADKGLVSGNLPFELLARVRSADGKLALDGVAIHPLR
jgi:tetratricopeptide (TPR) repeat protein